MKQFVKITSVIFLSFASLLAFSCNKDDKANANNGKVISENLNEESTEVEEVFDPTLNVISYSSFADSWGAGERIIDGFTEKEKIDVNLINGGSSSELVSYIKSNYSKGKIDVVVGLTDDYLTDEMRSYLTIIRPFDYSYYAFLIANNSKLKAPLSLSDLLKDEYKKQFILIDPRTSVVGLGLLYWTKTVYPDTWTDWWKKATENALTVASSWSEAYGLFQNGEAPIVLSYTTSPLYDLENWDEPFARSLEFTDGHIRADEYMAIVNNTEKMTNARKFIRFMLSPEAQGILSRTNVMFPSVKDAYPRAFELQSEPARVLEKDTTDSATLLDEWTKAVI